MNKGNGHALESEEPNGEADGSRVIRAHVLISAIAWAIAFPIVHISPGQDTACRTMRTRGISCWKKARAEVALDLRPLSSIELACAVRCACLLCANLLCCWSPRTWPACDHVGTQHQANIFFTLHTALFAPWTSRLTLALHIPQLILSQIIWLPHVTSSDLFSSHLIPSHMLSQQVLLNCFHSSEHWKKFISTHLSSSAHPKALTVRKKSFA